MGWGDELMAAGQARLMRAHDRRQVRIVKPNGTPRRHDAWLHNPDVAGPVYPQDCQVLVNAPGVRPYIAEKLPQRWVWRDYVPEPGRLCLHAHERAFAAAREAPQVVIGPSLKPGASPNKDWGAARWREFVRLALRAGLRLVQLGPAGTPVFPGVGFIETPSMRLACAVLARAGAYVGHEGGLHHSAAALGLPGVVIFGGYISPRQTGYALHRNLFEGGEPCGWRTPCAHCAMAMAAITPEQVLTELEVSIAGTATAAAV